MLSLTYPVYFLAALAAGILLAHKLLWGLLLLVPLFWLRAPGPLLLALCFVGWGYFHAAALLKRPDPLLPYYGKKWQLDGHWDGTFLKLREPEVRVALAPAPDVPAGHLVIRGTLNPPEGRRNFHGFDYAAWLKLRGVHGVLYGGKVVQTEPEQGFHTHFQTGLTTQLNPQHAALMVALELGDKQDLRDQKLGEWTLQEAFTRAGVAHFLALSGQHVAILVGLLEVLLRRFGRWRYGTLLGFLGLYLLLVGIEPSILRAVLQGGVVLLALWMGQGKLDLLGTLALTGLVSLTVYPQWLFDVGFQLSYLAVLGLSFTPEVVSKLPGGIPKWLSYPLAATFCAELLTLPVVAGNFNALPWISPISNLILGPFMVVLVPAGMLAGLLGPLAVVLNPLIGVVLSVFLWLVSLFAQVPPLPWGTISPAGLVLYLLWLFAAFLWLRNRLTAVPFLALSLSASLISYLPAQLFPPQRIVYLDVGQGDSTLLQLGHFTMLIDGGGSPGSSFDVGARTVVPALHKLGIFHLDVVVASHADTDHIEGLTAVLKSIPTAELWIGHDKEEDPGLREVLNAARNRKVPIREVRRGDQFRVGDSTLQVLYPEGTPWSKEDNDNSVVLRVQRHGFSTVFLGDLSGHLENRLGVGPLTVLKVAHHGSRHSSNLTFLQETRPRYAVISSGKNTYGHPHPEVLGHLQSLGVQILRTDQRGALMLYLP
ncbi:DNA internalization-related competence protein ComEC/Rec2 [Deinococcus cellulosilyticus]|uniref:DNA internalization-related competence protein ComEC/Rec2 n=1 Tax=Deinococcus cellulosilyticus (strain DSM 18568 / NBRC 106333 / KACC 11606 / 5516J-15) TaxID=1223518 RepID=A0A511N6J7_DEIC1|nr:DNA internalization-related competence protein ComEC/Rec2 [Deinococcus cellulosilyticus]GEM48088.1 DNA internalization-related competence protein ComEC/Rec2 [Deinococcus cellulosilyticus NBRC 106333 = KACC 11606]